ncbi:MAG: hypothetical protein WB767_13175, partial [Nocardioides sp.]
DLTAARWRFHQAEVDLGRRLPLPGRSVDRSTVRFEGAVGGVPAQVSAFDWACTPATLRVNVGGGWLRLRLHSYDALRQNHRQAGLDDSPRLYHAAIEVPAGTRRMASAPQRQWLTAHFADRFTLAPLEVTATRLKFRLQCWQLTRNGRPPHPDRPSVPDVGPLLDDVKTIREGGVPRGPC